MLAAVITMFLGFVAPQFEPLFRDFKTELPTPAKLVLIFSRFFVDDYGWILVWAIALTIPILLTWLIYSPATDQFRRRERLLSRLVGVLSLLLLGAFILALAAPLFHLVDTIAGGKH